MAGSLDNYTDEELARMLRAAADSSKAAKKELVSTFEAFCSFLNSVGLGFIADAIKMGTWAWEKVRNIWHRIFG